MKKLLLSMALSVSALSAYAGPVIIAGTDADDHGSVSGGVNRTGWFFMQRALENIAPQVTNGSTRIVCIGCNGSTASSALQSALSLSSIAPTWTSVSLTSTTDITNFFNGTGTVNVNNTGMVYMPTVDSNVGGGITNAQLAIVNANAAALNTFVGNGGGLFTQEQANSNIGYGWLSTLLPGLSARGDNGGPDFDSNTLTVTPAGLAAFPGLNDTIISSATPWHAWFTTTGNFGGLSALVTGPVESGPGGAIQQQPVVLGASGAGGGSITTPPPPTGSVPLPGTLALLGLGLIAFSAKRRAA